MTATVDVSSTPPVVVQVRIDSPVPHLDRAFDYLVPADLGDTVQVGCRVRVRFAGRLINAVVVARSTTTTHEGQLRSIERVIGTEPVLTPDTLALVDAVAQRWAGTFSDVVRSAVPPRHARAEKIEVARASWMSTEPDSATSSWSDYVAGDALLRRLAQPADPVRAVWSCAPASDWAVDAAGLVRAVTSQITGSAIVVVPDATDVDRMRHALADATDAGVVAVLTADMGPERRYREFLRILRGGVRVVIGTRASAFAPAPDLRLIVVWDDGDEALTDPQAPYWNARDVAALRSHLSGCHLVVGSPARSVVTQQWIETGWAKSLAATRVVLTERAPRVRAITERDEAADPAASAARLPTSAWQAARDGLARGPVLVQVARRGYVPALACQDCRSVARCTCGGPLVLRGRGGIPACSWCGSIHGDWSCPTCHGRRLRARAIGSERTVEEIGRAFPQVPVISSHGDHRLIEIDDAPAVVVATPGAEPRVHGGYRAVVLLDARALLARPAMDAEEDAARRWFAAAALAAPQAPIVIVAENSLAAVQALVRWDAPWLAARELAERSAAGLPPATRMAALVGRGEDVRAVADRVRIEHRLLGPLPDPAPSDPDRQRGLITVERRLGPALARELAGITAARSAEAKSRPVHVHLDPRTV